LKTNKSKKYKFILTSRIITLLKSTKETFEFLVMFAVYAKMEKNKTASLSSGG